jgi:hypothetical protein
MPDEPTPLHLLLTHADDREPVLPDGLDGAAAPTTTPAPKTKEKGPAYMWAEGSHPNDLSEQRWGIIAAEGPRGDRLLEIVRPLIRQRQEQQGGHEVRVYRVPSRMDALEAARWRKTVFDPGGDLAVELPRYQLLLGDLDEVPLALQQAQAADGFVGRLAFDGDDGYAAYVDKVLRWERGPSPQRQGDALFYAVNDGTRATEIGYDALVSPGLDVARSRRERGHFPAGEVTELGDPCDSAPRDLAAARDGRGPSVLLSLSHGMGAPRGGWSDAETRERLQGAMSFGGEGDVTGADLAGGAFLPGGLWFMVACYGAGTPDTSAYYPWLAKLRDAGQFPARLDPVLAGLPREGERPFVAALPKAALANPDGPLAFVGHVDLAWSYSFQALDSGVRNRPAPFVAVLHSALKGNRAGSAFRELYRHVDRASHELADHYHRDEGRGGDPSRAEAAALGHLWMLRQDLAAYVLLGDPAVHLPLAAPAARKVARSDAFLGLPPATPAPVPRSPEPRDDIDVEQLEEAIGEVLVGERGMKAIARDHGLEPARLRQAVDVYRAGGRAALADRDLV